MQFSRWTIWSSIAACVLAIALALPNLLPTSWREAMPGWLPKQTNRETTFGGMTTWANCPESPSHRSR